MVHAFRVFMTTALNALTPQLPNARDAPIAMGQMAGYVCLANQVIVMPVNKMTIYVLTASRDMV